MLLTDSNIATFVVLCSFSVMYQRSIMIYFHDETYKLGNFMVRLLKMHNKLNNLLNFIFANEG